MASGITPLKFTGLSPFSQDFQSILTRAAQVAALPVREIQNRQADLIARKQSLTALGSSVKSLEDSVRELGRLGETRSLSVTSSNTTKVAVALNGATAATSYTISEITSVARRASETSASGFADAGTAAVDADGSLELVLGSSTYAVNLASYGNNLNGLRDAINALGAGVTASVINTGSGGTPYYLSLSASSQGATTLALRSEAGAAASNVLTNSNQGSNAQFKLNGLAVVKSDNVVTDAIPGVTFTIQDTTSGSESVTLNLTSGRGGLATALQNFVSAYNAAADKVKTQIGENAGLLSGDYIVGQVHRALRTITGYNGAGPVKTLMDLGIELDKGGVMSFDASRFYALPSSTVENGFAFLGSRNSGFGALHARLGSITNPVTGLIKTQQNSYDNADRRLSAQVAETTARIERSQSVLALKLQQADVLLSDLQRQQSVLTSSVQSLTLATFGKRD